ncbi:MAG: DUF2207 domain-containing protein [Candidatus Promineofilum sp.]|nr:DUF2207 domain-containing protein [Promineifilum sp.]MBP9657785.1 DUF2207 domain-containing protein [Promineifilum sp.]
MTRKLFFGLLCCALFFTMGAQLGKSYRAERFDVEVAVQPDGSLNIEETVAFRFSGGPFSFVFRELPTDHTDGITGITAGVDGVTWPQGTGPGEVEISGRDPIRVEWHLPPTADTTQTFTLAYTQLGVVERGTEADVLNWQALPDEYEYEIDSSRLTVNFPPSGQLIGEPEITAGSAVITTEPGRAVFDMQNLSSGDPLVVRLSFAPGAFTGAPPDWQAQQASQGSRAWIWITAAVATLAAGFIALIRAARNNLRSVPKAKSYAQKPPLDLPPALAAYLANQSVSWQHALATLFDLAGRGHIEIEQTREKSLLRSAEFTLTLLNHPEGLRPHEIALLDLLFTDKSGKPHDITTMGEMSRLITSSRWKGYTRTLEDEAEQEGLTNPLVKGKQKKAIGWGVALLILAPVLLIAGALFDSLFGLWPLLLMGAVALIGFLAVIFGTSYNKLSDKGFQYATAFEPFRRFLEDVSKDKTSLSDDAYYEAYLPYATGYGLAEKWVKRMATSEDPRVPAYFRAAEADEAINMAAFIAVIIATTNSGGTAAASAAGAAGAAAAGGGASGAG